MGLNNLCRGYRYVHVHTYQRGFSGRMTCVSVVGYWGCYDPGPEASAED